jgi:hypothetical protein
MKPENYKYRAIDKILWKEWRIRVIFFSIALAFIALTYFSLPKETKILEATTISVGFAETDLGTRAFWVSKLDNGTLVRTPVINNRVFKKGQRIKLIEISSVIGTKKYRLSEVLNEEHNQAPKKDADKESYS